MNECIIGIDFDNTIVSYDELMHQVALEQGWIEPKLKKSKKQIRDQMRLTSGGEINWQKLQAIVYGERISDAQLMTGVSKFLKSCSKCKIKIFIISHKTRFANWGSSKDDLRVSALDFMTQRGFFDKKGLGLSVESVYFEATREEKVRRIGALKCTHFIDDLEETFLEKSFPKTVKKILFDPHHLYVSQAGLRIFTNWHEIYEFFFGS